MCYYHSNDNIYFSGYNHTGSNLDWWVKKFDADGTEDTANWDKSFDAESENDMVYSAASDYNNNIYVIVYRKSGGFSDWWIKKFDSDGTEDTTNWNKTFGSAGEHDAPTSIAIDNNDNIHYLNQRKLRLK